MKVKDTLACIWFIGFLLLASYSIFIHHLGQFVPGWFVIGAFSIIILDAILNSNPPKWW